MSTPQPPEQQPYPPYDGPTADYNAPQQTAGVYPDPGTAGTYPSPDSQATVLVTNPGSGAEAAVRRWQTIAGLAVAAAALVVIGFFAIGPQGRSGQAAPPVTTTITEVEEVHEEPTTRTATQTEVQRQTAVRTERETRVRTQTVTETVTQAAPEQGDPVTVTVTDTATVTVTAPGGAAEAPTG
ncbi:MAG: hypothetical protein QM809_05950 [Gordonia sp. (in: high G+C Gram-positive bacteria)]|uniref:hypothetical protein n=1 Tax=Gordonia sp. (in: high G+C Gram-positive bacteria) TaxID=84139 RepID=UPI0039E2D863